MTSQQVEQLGELVTLLVLADASRAGVEPYPGFREYAGYIARCVARGYPAPVSVLGSQAARWAVDVAEHFVLSGQLEGLDAWMAQTAALARSGQQVPSKRALVSWVRQALAPGGLAAGAPGMFDGTTVAISSSND